VSKFLVVATLIMNLAYAASDPECPCCRVKVSGSMNEHIRKCKSCGEEPKGWDSLGHKHDSGSPKGSVRSEQIKK
jgi:hypothetical protein